MAATPDYAAFKMVLGLLRVARDVYETAQNWKGRPTKGERDLLLQYCNRLDERRVFSVSFNDEAEMLCVGSLEQVKTFTDEVLSKLKHPAARAALGAILDQVRRFLDRWCDSSHPRRHASHGDWNVPLEARQRRMEFFQDLGELRGNMKLLVRLIGDLVPEVRAPNLLGDSDSP